jgi:putative endonuclease
VNTRKIGLLGECIAEGFLKRKGYKILERNWTCQAGEIDLVTLNENNKLVFVEVKYVGESNFCEPNELFTYKKKKALSRAIRNYLVKHQEYLDNWRLDLVCIFKGIVVDHFEDVTE